MLGVNFLIEDVTARPGELVSVPVLASSEEPLAALRLALELDPDLTVEGLDVEYIDHRDGVHFRRVLEKGQLFTHQRCDNPGTPDARCTFATPFLAALEGEVPSNQALVDFLLTSIDGVVLDWIGPEIREVARLQVRVSPAAVPHVARIRPASIFWPREGGEVASGGFANLSGYRFGPAESVEGGFITIQEAGRFVRGDCNGDGEVAGQVSDAIFHLSYNFLGGREPPCLAACDANGDGKAEGQVADAIYLLQFNFMGGPPLPPPYPDCAAGGDSDIVLGCRTSSCP